MVAVFEDEEEKDGDEKVPCDGDETVTM